MKQLFMQKKAIRAAAVAAEDVPVPSCEASTVLIANRHSLISAGTETTAVAGSKRDMVLKALKDPDIRQSVVDMLVQDGLPRTAERVHYEMTKWTPLGYSGAGIAVEVGPEVDGVRPGNVVAYGGQGHAEYIRVPKNLCVPVPAGVSTEEASFVALGSIALQGVRRAEVQVGDCVAVLGLGLVGQLVSQLLQAAGARVLGTDLLPFRLERATQLGMEAGFASSPSVADEIRRFTGGTGVDRVVICASTGNPAVVEDAVKMARDRGRIVVVGGVPLEVPRHDFYMKELDLVISRSYGPGRYDKQYEEHGVDYPIGYVRWTERRNMQEFLRLIQIGKVNVKLLVTHQFSVDEAGEAYQRLMQSSSECLAVLLRYHEDSRPVVRRVPVAAPQPVKAAPQRQSANVAVIGCGSFAREFYLPNLRACGQLHFHTLVASSGQNAKEMARRYQAEFSSTDAAEVVRDPHIDAVMIFTRDKLHAGLASAAIEAGKHVFCEKPLATTLEECLRLNTAALGRDRVCLTGFNRRFAPMLTCVKETLDSCHGPKTIHYRVNAGTLPADSWVYDPAHSGGRIVGEACHFVDLFRWLIGAEPVRVMASAVGDLPASNRLEDVCATIDFADGSVGMLLYTAQGSKGLGKERLEAFCAGTAVAMDDFRHLSIRGVARRNQHHRRPDKGHHREFAHFAQAIRGEVAPSMTLQDGLQATVVCLAIIESARLNTPIELDDIWAVAGGGPCQG